MRVLEVFQVLTGEWCAGTSSYNTVFADTKEDVIIKWKSLNPYIKVKIKES